ncbi:alpha/beta-hydrolase [Xylaria nigripes]|nr:alpha/beta-hydrolase [Xylaria nigripes]
MAPETKPTLLIVHGAWHVPDHYYKLRDVLESQGYEVHIPALPSNNGMQPPNADMYTDILHVRGYAESLVRAGRTVVAILHSYGGQVASNALHGLGVEARAKQGRRGGVSHLIYMTAYALLEGMSVMDKTNEFGQLDLARLFVDFADDGTCLYRDPKGIMIGPGSDEAEIDEYAAKLVRLNAKVLSQGAEHAAWREIPVSYIYTTLDMCLPLSHQQSMVEAIQKAGYKPQIFELDAHHCPHLTATEDVAKIVNKVILG